MRETAPSPEWLEEANHLATVAAQLTSVLHGLNNVLQVISGNAEMLQTTEGVPEAAVRRATVIGAQALRASALLTEVLTLSRVTAAGVERIDVREVAAAALAMRSYVLAKARVEVSFEPSEGA